MLNFKKKYFQLTRAIFELSLDNLFTVLYRIDRLGQFVQIAPVYIIL